MLAVGSGTAGSGAGGTASATGTAAGTGLGAGAAGNAGTGRVAQPTSHTLPTMTVLTHHRLPMLLLLLEALFAGLLFVGIIWWTMFSGRQGGELPRTDEADQSDRKP